MPLIIFAVLGFVALPYDAQIWVLAQLRAVPPEVWYGAAGSAAAGSVIYSAGWNGLAAQLHREDVSRADEALQKRRR